MRARVSLLALVVAVLGAVPARAASVPKVPNGWIGMLADSAVFDPQVSLYGQFRAMRRAGVQTVRIPFYGADVQPAEGGPLNLSREDRFVMSAARAGLRVLPVVLTVPAWARVTPSQLYSGPSESKGVSWYRSYIVSLMRRYGPRGSLWREHKHLPRHPLRQWQIWNEPLTQVYWHEASRTSAYARLLKKVAPTIRAHDPKAKIIIGGLVGLNAADLRDLYRLGARRFFDEVAIHPFTFKVRDVLRLVGSARQVMDDNGDHRKGIALTEVAWPTALNKVPFKSSYGFEVTEREQAHKLHSAFHQLAKYRKRLRITGVVWASWMTTDQGTYPFNYAGLRRLGPRGKIFNKPGYYAFRKVAREIAR